MLRRNVALAPTMADFVALLGGAEYAQTKAVGDIVREIGAVNARDAAAVKVRSLCLCLLCRNGHPFWCLSQAFAAFLPELAQRAPSLVLANVALLVAQLDSESYTMRNGVVQVVGHLARDAFGSSQQDASLANTRDSLLGILEERARDVHAFTRAKVLQTWQSLVE